MAEKTSSRYRYSVYRAPFPDPPEKELTPIEYFKKFFDDELIDHIVEQSNLYSVPNCGINTINCYT